MKKRKPFEKLNFDSSEIEANVNKHLRKIGEVNYPIVLKGIIQIISNFKRGLDKQNIKENISQLENELKKLVIGKLRYEYTAEIKELKYLEAEGKRLEEEKSQLQKELEEKTRKFVEEYFKDINENFSKFRGNDYEILPLYTKRGNQPVFEPKILFKNTEIDGEIIPYVFSDSDRRSLGFAIFLSFLKKKGEQDLRNTIIILDDPVSSFDDDRVSQTIIEIKWLILKSRQLIILSHNSQFIKKLSEQIGDTKIKLLEIKRNVDTSYFDEIKERLSIRFDPYAFELEKVRKFIDGNDSIGADNIKRVLRIILQRELEWRYRIYLGKQKFTSPSEIAEILYKDRVINENIKFEINSFNDAIRDEHHNFNETEPFNIRSIARNLIDFIFKKLNP